MSLFEGNDQITDDIDPNAPLPDNYLDRFKESQKEDVIKEKYKTDMYVKTLEDRLDEMRKDYMNLREDYTSRASLEEIVNELKASSTNTPNQSREDPPKNTVDMSEIDKMVSSKIQEAEVNRIYQNNYNEVQTKLREQFGSRYPSVLKERSEELGLSEDFVNDLARKSPKALFKTLDLENVPSGNNFQAPPRSNQNTPFTPNVPKRTWSYYQNMKKEKPNLYWDKKTQVQMHKDAEELGKAFEDGDFNL